MIQPGDEDEDEEDRIAGAARCVGASTKPAINICQGMQTHRKRAASSSVTNNQVISSQHADLDTNWQRPVDIEGQPFACHSDGAEEPLPPQSHANHGLVSEARSPIATLASMAWPIGGLIDRWSSSSCTKSNEQLEAHADCQDSGQQEQQIDRPIDWNPLMHLVERGECKLMRQRQSSSHRQTTDQQPDCGASRAPNRPLAKPVDPTKGDEESKPATSARLKPKHRSTCILKSPQFSKNTLDSDELDRLASHIDEASLIGHSASSSGQVRGSPPPKLRQRELDKPTSCSDMIDLVAMAATLAIGGQASATGRVNAAMGRQEQRTAELEEERGGPTPTNDLIRALIHRDRLALGAGSHMAKIRDEPGSVAARGPSLASHGSWQASRQDKVHEARSNNGDNFDDDADCDCAKESSYGRSRHGLDDDKDKHEETDMTTSGTAGRAMSWQAALSQRPKEENYLMQKAKLEACGGGETRRHSSYLFPLLLEQPAASSHCTHQDADSDSDPDPDQEQLGSSLGSGSQLNLFELSEDEESDPLGAAARHTNNCPRLRLSASSPCALATPTNESFPTGDCTSSCCRPPARGGNHLLPRAPQLPTRRASALLGGALDAQLLSHLRRKISLGGHQIGPTGASGEGRGRRKRRSMIGSLSSGGSGSSLHLGARLSLPRSLFSGSSASLTAGSRRESSSGHDGSMDSSSSLYEPLIPEEGFKIAVMGSSGCGKTSVIHRFLYSSFSWRHVPTVEDTYFVEFPYQKSTINISIADTSGFYQFPAMRRLAINSSDAFILVYSVDEPKSLDNLKLLRQSILDEREQACREQAPGVPHETNQPPARQDQGTVQPTKSQGRHWSLASILSNHSSSSSRGHPCQVNGKSLGSSAACSLSSSAASLSSGGEGSSWSRRSSVSAAEAALRTRRTRYPPMVVVANKQDLPEQKHLINSDEIEALVLIDWNNGFVRASAALNQNIDLIFQQVLMQARQPPNLTEAIVSKRRRSLPVKLKV